MNKPLQSALYMLAPCVFLGVFGVFLMRRPPQVLVIQPSGPFALSVAGIETVKIAPVNVHDGYDRNFQLVFGARGPHPKWWGQPIGGRSGVQMTGWQFFLERGGKRTSFHPTKTQIWTTDWNASKKRYSNEFRLHCGPIPDDAILKMKGQTHLSLSNRMPLGPQLPFEVTLKKAGQHWAAPHVSTDPHIVIRKIEILPPKKGQTVAVITVQLSPGTDFGDDMQYSTDFLNPDWTSTSTSMLRPYFRVNTTPATGAPPNPLKTCELQWYAHAVANAPQRDLIVSQRYSIAGNWPFEIAFPVKKAGRPLVGVVPALTRLRPP